MKNRLFPSVSMSSPLAAAIVTALLAGLLSACGAGGADPGTVVIIDDRGRGEARTAFAGLKLLMTEKDVIGVCEKRGWKHNIKADKAKDARAHIIPDAKDEVRRFSLSFEDGALIQLTIEYEKPDRSRHGIARDYARKKRLDDGSWAMTDGRRDTVVIINREGNRLVVVHVGKARDRTESERLLKHFVGESSSDRPAEIEKDPKAGDAPKP